MPDSDPDKSSLHVDSPFTTLETYKEDGIPRLPVLERQGHATPQRQFPQPQQQEECTPSAPFFTGGNNGVINVNI